MNKETLLRTITPAYNNYQAGHGTLKPTELLSLLWDIGAAIDAYLQTNNVPPHTLYRDIYGKSEGLRNVKQRGYISREFLGRCYRVRRMFASKTEIKKIFPKLAALNHFRESMPFFDNPKYALGIKEKQQLIRVINSTASNKVKEKYIQDLQSKIIGIKNPRTQQLDRLNEDKLVFIKFYNDIFHALQLRSFEKAKKIFSIPSTNFLKVLSLNTGAISADGLMTESFDLPKNLDDRWKPFAELVLKMISDKNPRERRRFRRLIPSERMIRLSEMLFALSSSERYGNYLK